MQKINEDNKDYYKYKQDHITRYLAHQTTNNSHKNYNSMYEVWAARLQEYDIKQLILTMPNTFNENPFTLSLIHISASAAFSTISSISSIESFIKGKTGINAKIGRAHV